MSSSQAGPSAATKVSFGFKKTPLPPQRNAAASPLLLSSRPKSSAFTSLQDDEDEEDLESSNVSASTSKISSQPRPKKSSTTPPPTGLAHSAPPSKVSRQKAQEAKQLDSSVYEYDEVFDSLKSAQRSQALKRQEERAKRDPKYIEGMLDSVKERNKLLLRAQAKKIQRERDAEGGEFGEGEEFITDAYREQQEELSKVEEAERMEEEKQAKNKKGLSSFYKDMMASKEAEHDAAVAAAAAAAAGSSASRLPGNDIPSNHCDKDATESLSHEDRQKRLAQKAKRKGLNAQLNEEGELVDQRSVLSAGLNVLSKAKGVTSRQDAAPPLPPSSHPHHPRAKDGASEAQRIRQEARQRASRQVEDQILQVEQLRNLEKAKEEEERKRVLVGERRNDEAKIAEAKKRLEERKAKKRRVEESLDKEGS